MNILNKMLICRVWKALNHFNCCTLSILSILYFRFSFTIFVFLCFIFGLNLFNAKSEILIYPCLSNSLQPSQRNSFLHSRVSEWVSEWSSTDLRIGNWMSSDCEVVSTHHKQDVLEIIIIISWKVRQLLITAVWVFTHWEKWRERVIARNWNVCEMQIKWLVTITQCMSLLRLNSTSNWWWRARPLNMGNDRAATMLRHSV